MSAYHLYNNKIFQPEQYKRNKKAIIIFIDIESL